MNLDWADYLRQVEKEVESDKDFRDRLLSLRRRYVLYCHSTITEDKNGLKSRQNDILANSSCVEDLQKIRSALGSINIHFSFIYDRNDNKILEIQ